MLHQKFKPRKCKLKSCRKEFTPVTKWQEFHAVKCRSAHAYLELAKLARAGRKAREKQEAANG